ncbi:MAG: flagellar basal body P-ring formation protein FlgA [Proteobacteria bacterium]|nr:flagellar basal body P-ring formation protein FlgA [Pseudomonadota bacterium]
MRTLMAIAALTLILAAASADAAQTRDVVTVKGDLVRLGDLFEGIGEKASVAIARAPVPGGRAVYNATRLASFAYSHGIAWRPVSRFDRVIIERASQIIGREEIHAALRGELEKRGIARGSEVEFTSRRTYFHLPIGVPATLAVQNLNYQRRTGRFTATVTAPADHPSPASLVVTGRVYKVIEVPVLNRRVPKGGVITADDIDWVRLPAMQVRRNIIVDEDRLIGKTPRRGLRAGQPIRNGDVRAPVVVAKGSLVTMILKTRSMVLTSKGRAIENGAIGDTVKIMNTRSKTVIEAVVAGVNRVTVNSTVILP